MTCKSRCTRWFGFALASVSLGCAGTGVDRCAEIPVGSMPEPPHTVVRRIMDTQAAKAEADDFVVYKHEFYLDGSNLGPYGQYHLRLIANRLASVPFPVLIQAAADPKLNEQRRQTVIAFLKRAGVDEIEPRIIVGFPEAEGMGGNEAERIYNSFPDAGTGVRGMNQYNRGFFNNGGFLGAPNNGAFRSSSGFNSFPF